MTDPAALEALRGRAAAGDAAAQVELARALEARGDQQGAVDWLCRAADGGHVSAMTDLGRRWLTGRGAPFRPQQAIQALVQAANSGGGEAAALVAVLAGGGVGVAQDWSLALDYLRRAAAAGHAPASRQLKLLEDRPGASGDVSRWLEAPEVRVLSTAPRVTAVPGFLAPAWCDWITERARERMERARIYDPAGGAGREDSARTNSAAEFLLADLDLVFVLVQAKIARLTGLSTLAMEPPNVLHYSPGQKFDRHVDYLDPANPAYADDLARRRQRVLTFLVYLNEGYEGGETAFLDAGVSYKGEKGDGLLWWNVTPDGQPDLATVHAGLPPTTGEKWVLSQWVRDRSPAA